MFAKVCHQRINIPANISEHLLADLVNLFHHGSIRILGSHELVNGIPTGIQRVNGEILIARR